jgi:hypothetical protein
MVQVHVPARAWGFESLLRHQFLTDDVIVLRRAVESQLARQTDEDGDIARREKEEMRLLSAKRPLPHVADDFFPVCHSISDLGRVVSCYTGRVDVRAMDVM